MLLSDLQRAAREAPESVFGDLPEGSQVTAIMTEILHLAINSPLRDETAMFTATQILQSLYTSAEDDLEIGVLASLLDQMCRLSSHTNRSVTKSLSNYQVDGFFNHRVAAALFEFGLLDLYNIDLALTRGIQQRKPAAVECMSELMG